MFNEVVYPRDKSWEISTLYNLNNIENMYEYKNCFPEFQLDQFNNNHTNKTKILTLNLCYIPHPTNENNYVPFQNKDNYKLIYSKKHFNNLKAYQYEGFSIKERILTDKMKLYLKLYSK